jgi:uncharacterized protein
MRLLVVSDSHGDVFGLHCAIDAQPAARMIIHLGDGERDMDALNGIFGEKKIVQVRGNGDFNVLTPYNCVEMVEGKRIYCTHGERERVKYGTAELKNIARNEKADIVLYGHTHTPRIDYDDGLHLFNPGSIKDGDYGVLDITGAGIVCIRMRLSY